MTLRQSGHYQSFIHSSATKFPKYFAWRCHRGRMLSKGLLKHSLCSFASRPLRSSSGSSLTSLIYFRAPLHRSEMYPHFSYRLNFHDERVNLEWIKFVGKKKLDRATSFSLFSLSRWLIDDNTSTLMSTNFEK